MNTMAAGVIRLCQIRRSGVTAVADMGFPPHVCDRLLNHMTGAISGVAAVCQRAEFLTERRRTALETWAKHVLASADPAAKAHNVLPPSRPVA